MLSENLFQKIKAAEKTLLREAEQAEQARLALIEMHRGVIRKRAREALEETPEVRQARETIERIQLRLELLRNIKMNWRIFQAGLIRKGMKMRINQHAHLEHLIAFLETGRGVMLGDSDEVDAEQIDPAHALMTHEIQPTGAGKTGAFAIDIALMDVPSLTLVPFDSLLDQTKKDMMKIGSIPEDQIGIVGGGTKEVGRKHTVATYAGHAAQMRRGGDYAKFMKTQCKLVICDEVHHQALGDRMQESIKEIDTLDNGDPTEEEIEMLEAERDVISHLNEQTGVKSLKIGFTATPRGSQKDVRQFFPHCLGRVYHKEMVEAGLVVPYKIIQCDGSVFAGELDQYLNQEEEAAILEREQIYKKLIGEYAEVLASYRTIKRKQTEMPMRGMAFCTNHAECEKFAKEAETHSLRCRIVTGKEAKGRAGQAVINEAVDALLREEIDLIVTVEKLATGFNREEINAIVSARITSAAKTVQYIGRGARSYTDEKDRMKTHCLVFETNWTLKKNAKRGKKPLRLADALAFNGEEPEAICSMMDGSLLQYSITYRLDNNGIVQIKDKEAVGLSAYSDYKDIDTKSLMKFVKEAKLQSVAVQIISGTRPVEVFWRDEVDSLLPYQANELGEVILPYKESESGERTAVTRSKYKKEIGLGPDAFDNLMRGNGIQPVSGFLIKNQSRSVIVYWKDEAEEVLKRVIDSNGEVIIHDRTAIALKRYFAKHGGIAMDTVMEALSSAGIRPIPNVLARSGVKPIEVYWKDEVENALPKIQHQIEIDGRIAITQSAFIERAKGLLSHSTLFHRIEANGIQPVPNVTVRVKRGPAREVFWLDELEKIINKTD